MGWGWEKGKSCEECYLKISIWPSRRPLAALGVEPINLFDSPAPQMILSVPWLNTKSLESSLKISSTPDSSCILQASFWPLSWPKLPRISLGILSCGLIQLPRVWNHYVLKGEQRRMRPMPALLSSRIDRLCILTHKQSGLVLEANDIIAQGRATNVITAFPTVRQHTVLTQTHRIMSFCMHLLRPDGCVYMEIWVLSEVGTVFSWRFKSQVKGRHCSHEWSHRLHVSSQEEVALSLDFAY